MRRLSALVATALLVGATSAGAATAPGVPSATRLALGAPSPAPSDLHVARKKVSARVARALGPTGELRGMALNDLGVTRPATLAIPDFPRLAAEGVTSVSVYIYLYVAAPTANQVSTGPYTPSDSEIHLIAAAASANGLGLHLMPVLLDTATGTWRGRYAPSDIPQFFSSYTQQLVHYADIAQSAGATLFYVGSENRRIEGYTAQWRAVIHAVRQHFSGALGYMAIASKDFRLRFLDALDLVAVSVYFSMSDDPAPSYARDVAAWEQVHLATVRTIAARSSVPLVYGEAGYDSQRGTFGHPELPSSPTGVPAPAAQADAYAALLDVLARTPQVHGVTWWRWSTGTTVADNSYSPNGKPAECVLAAHWSPYAEVRTLASQPVCDLHALDSAAGTLPPL
ncbi:MAG: glycoside hydrolase family 113 [Nocardioides sp.]